jgi:anti-sigma factor RsiW
MSCELYDEVLDKYVDGARAADRAGAPDPRLAAFESHLSGCARCQSLVADFTSIRRTAAALDEHLPPPRLWAKIASSIEDEQRKPWWERSLANTFSAWVPVAVAASLAILLGGTAWLVWRPAPSTALENTALENTALENTAPQNAGLQPADPAVTMAEQHYEQAIAGLQQIADAQNAGLDPGTRAVLRQNLAVIDRAISESRAALSTEPASVLAQESLLDALDTKVALLQDTVALASEIGGERPDDAAGAAQELNQ